ncbi:hypothetical protein, partial [Nocardia pseudovaccinii]|uniref:hypothetical protein n=1 Tax=Nocardia pseudovaccinii TaxID=189540 RepID=UPI001C3FC192
MRENVYIRSFVIVTLCVRDHYEIVIRIAFERWNLRGMSGCATGSMHVLRGTDGEIVIRWGACESCIRASMNRSDAVSRYFGDARAGRFGVLPASVWTGSALNGLGDRSARMA